MKAPGFLEPVKAYELPIAGALAIAESAILLWSSLQTGEAVGAFSFLYLNSADLGHLIAYLLYGLLLARVFLLQGNGGSRPILLALAIGASFGFINEGIQSLVPGRDFSLADMLVNAIGSAIGGWLSAKTKP